MLCIITFQGREIEAMYDVLIEFLQFFGVSVTPPETVGEFVVWFVMVCAALAILKFVIKLFFDMVCAVGGSGRW